MTVTIHATTKIVKLNGIDCRIWEGTTAAGINMHAYIARVAVAEDLDDAEFRKELEHMTPPSPEVEEIPLRMVI